MYPGDRPLTSQVYWPASEVDSGPSCSSKLEETPPMKLGVLLMTVVPLGALHNINGSSMLMSFVTDPKQLRMMVESTIATPELVMLIFNTACVYRITASVCLYHSCILSYNTKSEQYTIIITIVIYFWVAKFSFYATYKVIHCIWFNLCCHYM